jgi:hypothetical protein
MTDTPESPITLPSDIGIEVKQGSGVSVMAVCYLIPYFVQSAAYVGWVEP